MQILPRRATVINGFNTWLSYRPFVEILFTRVNKQQRAETFDRAFMGKKLIDLSSWYHRAPNIFHSLHSTVNISFHFQFY